MRPADEETTDVKKVVSQEEGDMACHTGPRTRVGQEAEGMRGKCRQEPFMGSLKGRVIRLSRCRIGYFVSFH